MASSDVIELGSSDDEAEPVSKKVCRRVKKKPTLNAMVHFPNEVPGLIIKPVKPALPNLQKVLAGGAITITNVKKGLITPITNKSMPNGKPAQKFVQKSNLKTPVITTKPIPISNFTVNPFNLMKKQEITVQRPKLKLPPGITVKRTAIKRKIMPNELSGRNIRNVKKNPHGKIITTVELDDDEVPLTTGTSPQWYLRPEEQTPKKEDITEDKKDDDKEKEVTMELENNKEPDTKSYIEITIEDSPIKPLPLMKGFEVGSELPITIEDSPIKLIKSVKDQSSGSDSDSEKNSVTEPQSKKKLDYPNDKENLVNVEAQKVVEIDLDVVPNAVESKESSVENKCDDVTDESKTVTGDQDVNTPARVHSQTVLITKEVNEEQISSKQPAQSASGEFHPTYQKFIDLCFDLENSDDMVKIVEKKIKTYYKQCPKEYVESEEFTDMVSSKIFAMKAAPDKMYLYIKDVVDELNLQRKTARAMGVSNKENKKSEGDDYSIAEDGEYDSKRRRQIRKLEKTIKKLHRAIQKLEEQEVEFEDEEDSVYLLTERYKERLIRVHAKFCQLTNTKMPSEPRIQIEARPGMPTGPAKRLEKWVNKKVPIGTPLPFPDFHDVLQCVRDANVEDRLGWNEADIMEEARDLFTRCGKKLQRRRQENEWRIAAARLSHDVSAIDPAEKSDDLKNKLEENKTLAAKKEIELLNKYADKQHQLKLVGEEIGDREAEESPVESEDDECQDESNSLEDKQKRKERLKRLLHEKTRKNSTDKEMVASEVNVNKEENEAVERQEKMECETVLEELENKKVINESNQINQTNQNVINKAEVKSDNVVENISNDGPRNFQKEEKTNESDLYDVDSDIDELHLLQKLYSENEINTSTQDSGSDTPIAISDTLDSDSENENVKLQQSDDIISIENSSYSESEVTKGECEGLKASEVVKDKKIDGLLMRNAEVLLISSTSRDKMDIDEENILLASSEEENDVSVHLHVDKNKFNGQSDKVDCELILDNSDENSLDNEIKTYEVPLSEENIYEISEPITSNNFGGNQLDVQDHSELSEIMSQESNIQLENDIEIENSKNSLASIEKDKDSKFNHKAVRSPCDDVTTDANDKNCIANDIVCQIDNYKSEENYNLLTNQSHIDKVELKITANKDTNSEHLEDDSKLSYQETIIEEIEEIETNNVKMFCNEQDLNDCQVTDVNVNIHGDDSLISSKQITNEDVDIATSVQCK